MVPVPHRARGAFCPGSRLPHGVSVRPAPDSLSCFPPQVVHTHKPHFMALHCQEFGGKNYEASMSHVDKFVK